MLLQDADILLLPATIKKISILGCSSLTDNALLYLAKLPIEEISLSCSLFSQQALTTFFHKVSLKKLHLQDSHLYSDAFLFSLHGHPARRDHDGKSSLLYR